MSCMYLLTERDFKDNFLSLILEYCVVEHVKTIFTRTQKTILYCAKFFKRPQIKGIIKYTPQQKIELLRKNKSQH